MFSLMRRTLGIYALNNFPIHRAAVLAVVAVHVTRASYLITGGSHLSTKFTRFPPAPPGCRHHDARPFSRHLVFSDPTYNEIIQYLSWSDLFYSA